MKSSVKTKVTVIAVGVCACFFVSSFGFHVTSAAQYTPLIDEFPQVVIEGQNTDLGGYINFIVRLVIGLTGILAVAMIIVGGIQYVSTDAWTEKDSGKKRIQAAVGGLILALSSYLILNTIDPSLTYLNFTEGLKPVKLAAPLQVIVASSSTGGGSGTTTTPTGPEGEPLDPGTPVGNSEFMRNFTGPINIPVRATTYSHNEPGVDIDTQNFRSSTGTRLRYHDGVIGVVAVASSGQDAGLIPYGSVVVIGGKRYVAVDTGGAVNNRTASEGTLPIVDIFTQNASEDRNITVQVYRYNGNYAGLSAAQKEQFFLRGNY